MKNQSEALEHASVRQYCKTVRVPAIGANFVSLAEQAVKENQTHIRYLEALLQVESEERDRHAIANRTRDAQLPRLKTLEEFDFGKAPQIPAAKIRELAEGGYIERSEPVVRSANVERARATWPPGSAWPRAGRKGARASRQRRRWSTNWWRPSRTIRCGE
jgi:crotonobetainyl-CoA:carnitine CoA-transferase CaiB-like acyl-CoA transferase